MSYKKQDDETVLYLNRTIEHIHRVQKRGVQVAEYLLLSERVQPFMYELMKHDRSKFSTNQYEPYKNFTYYMKHKVKMTDRQKTDFQLAWSDHYNAENHHPEKEQICYLTGLEPYETACDLQAMADEFGEGSGRIYFNKVWKEKMKDHFRYDNNCRELKTYITFDRYCNMMVKAFNLFEWIDNGK